MKMEIRSAASPKDTISYDTRRLREEFLIDGLFNSELSLTYSQIDRMIVGGIAPLSAVALESEKTLGSDYFCERRELGILNLGETGSVIVDGQKFLLRNRDGLYVGMGAREVVFDSEDPDLPAKFYILSAPAHKNYPTLLIRPDGEAGEGVVIVKDENKLRLGDERKSNVRTICKYIVPGQVQSCQLCMGITSLEQGSVWNSMPCHTHDRRMEVYLYFDLPQEDAVIHLMGEKKQTRHLVMHNEQAVISPSWSIHAGCGTSSYSFVWGMCGENQLFDDMDQIATKDLQ